MLIMAVVMTAFLCTYMHTGSRSGNLQSLLLTKLEREMEIERPFSCCWGELYVQDELGAAIHSSTEQTTRKRALKVSQRFLGSIILSAICSCSWDEVMWGMDSASFSQLFHVTDVLKFCILHLDGWELFSLVQIKPSLTALFTSPQLYALLWL